MNSAWTDKKLNILVVEDSSMIAMLLEDLLVDLGCTVLGPAGSVAQALAALQGCEKPLDGAFLDVNLGSETVYPVADALLTRGVPFVFLTGYAAHGIEPRYSVIPALKKPFLASAIENAVKRFSGQA
jgi:CheY-like chemotaxis protein